jgi:hypothetical protein
VLQRSNDIKTNKMVTVQFLKDNREEIITEINKVGNPTFLKEIMTSIFRLVNAEMSDANDVEELVEESLEGIEKWRKQGITLVDTQNFFEEQRAKQIAFMNYNG